MKFAGLVGVLLLVAGQAQAAPQTQCAANERVIFSCVTGNKIVSVCASRDLGQHAGSLSYRFGPAGRPEISYPPPGASRDVVKAGRWVFAGGGGAWLAFDRPPFRYIVYSAVGRGWHKKAGLAVEKNGRVLTNLRCGGTPVTNELGPDFFSSSGITEDQTPFDLP
jgi:hypothetical protein